MQLREQHHSESLALLQRSNHKKNQTKVTLRLNFVLSGIDFLFTPMRHVNIVSHDQKILVSNKLMTKNGYKRGKNSIICTFEHKQVYPDNAAFSVL